MLIFLLLLVNSFLLWAYAVFTTSIDYVHLGILPMFGEMPPTFWVGFGLLILATLVWYFSSRTENIHLLLILFWTLYLFIGPELMEANARGVDTWDHLLGVTYLDKGRFTYSEYGYYSGFPGFVYLSSFIYNITGIDYHYLPVFMASSLHLLRAVGVWYFATRLIGGKKEILLCSLLFISFLWIPLETDPCPQNFGFILFLFLLGLLLSPHLSSSSWRIIAIMIFATIVMTHTLVATSTVVLLLVVILVAFARRPIKFTKGIGLNTALPFGVLLFTWLFYVADWVPATAIYYFKCFLREPLSPVQFLEAYSPYRAFSLYLSYLFYSLLAIWLLFIITSRQFWDNLNLNRLFPILCATAMSFIPLSGFYAAAGLARLYLFTTPFLAWFLAQESKIRSHVVPIMLIILTVLSFTLRYSQEYVYLPATTDFYGARFVCEKVPLSSTVYWGRLWSPQPKSMVNKLDEPQMVDIESIIMGKEVGRDIQFAAKYSRLKNTFLFYNPEWWDLTEKIIYGQQKNVIYSNGDFELYGYPR